MKNWLIRWVWNSIGIRNIILVTNEKFELSHDFSILWFSDSSLIVRRRCEFILMDFRRSHDVYVFFYLCDAYGNRTSDWCRFRHRAPFTNEEFIQIHYCNVISAHLINERQITLSTSYIFIIRKWKMSIHINLSCTFVTKYKKSFSILI